MHGPEYPRSSLRNEESGTSALSIRVSNTGKILGVDLVKSSGFPNLDNAVVGATYVRHGTRVRPGYKEETRILRSRGLRMEVGLIQGSTQFRLF